MRFAHLVATLPLFIPGLPAAGAGDPSGQAPPARRLIASGNEEALWLVVGEWSEKQGKFTRHLLFRNVASERIRAASISPDERRIAAAAVAGDTLHLFFMNGDHYRFSSSRSWRAHPLPGNAVPLALAGESRGGHPRLWAVVSPETGTRIEAEQQERELRQSTSPPQELDAESDTPSPSVLALPAPDENRARDFRIVFYDGTAWQPGMAAPVEYSAHQKTWLAVADGRVHLFWTTPDDPGRIRYARHENGEWSAGSSISMAGPSESAEAAVMNKQLVFAALLKRSDRLTFHCERWSRAAGGSLQDPWDQPPPLLDQDGVRLSLPAVSALGLFGDQLVLMRFTGERPESASWMFAVGGKPDQPFAPIPDSVGQDGTASRNSMRDLIAMLVVAAMLLLLLWSRQETVGLAVPLPVGLQVAGLAKRGLAFLVDAAPAAAVVFWLWFEPITAFVHQIQSAGAAGGPAVEAPAQVLWAFFWFRIAYIGYSALFEMLFAATPGKRLFGCQVLSETMDRPRFLQIGIRNVSRMIELEPFLKIWPFLLVVFFTRNRQRAGDLLGRTIVVERQAMALPDGQPRTDQPQDEA